MQDYSGYGRIPSFVNVKAARLDLTLLALHEARLG